MLVCQPMVVVIDITLAGDDSRFALTTGTAFGLAAAYFANDKVLKKLRTAATSVVAAARDAALNTREGQAWVPVC